MRRPKALKKIVDIIRKVAPKAEIILFGSEARGEARPDSDFDILILEDTESISLSRAKEITDPLFMLAYDEGIEVQPILRTKHEWENRPCVTPFYNNVMTDGIRL
jgi:predicted nucleotidyltransferase